MPVENTMFYCIIAVKYEVDEANVNKIMAELIT